MKIRALLVGKVAVGGRSFSWDLIFTPVTSPGTFAPGNCWTVRIDRANGEIVFDRNGLYVRTNINTIAEDVLSMGESEKVVVAMFCDLLRTYPEDEYVTVSLEFSVDDDGICRYLLNPILTVNHKRFTVTP